jgi:hypothetical protein
MCEIQNMHVYIFHDNIFCHYIRWCQMVKSFNFDQGDEGSNFTKWT